MGGRYEWQNPTRGIYRKAWCGRHGQRLVTFSIGIMFEVSIHARLGTCSHAWPGWARSNRRAIKPPPAYSRNCEELSGAATPEGPATIEKSTVIGLRGCSGASGGAGSGVNAGEDAVRSRPCIFLCLATA